MTMTMDTVQVFEARASVPVMAPEAFRAACARVKFAASSMSNGRSAWGRSDGVWAILDGEETIVLATDGYTLAQVRIPGAVAGARADRGTFYPLASLVSSGRRATKGWPTAAADEDAEQLSARVLTMARDFAAPVGPALVVDHDDALVAFRLAKATGAERAEYRAIGSELDIAGSVSPDGIVQSWATWANAYVEPAPSGDGWPVVAFANPVRMLEALRVTDRGNVRIFGVPNAGGDPRQPVSVFAFISGNLSVAVYGMFEAVRS